ncbi:hypothetical protein DYBT9623_00269 [Dyadobacter sp. CECT 9623]|uniref:histidine kinase n=1 Tax=Dyadobacter linearis TaxID=2823330 RepID=A0ABM8UJF7_9BACT|nr:sensor histidine kinase [Dyadobacter sp. CECT 9623]CAG5067548.1 hypothetical protein DYBT9623_00269 [Dyadobacter sp. CECT 9623]
MSLYQTVYAQNNSKTAYQRLFQTQQDYKAALLAGDSAQIAEECYLLGKRFMGIDNYAKAQQWLLKSLSLRTPHGPSEDIGKIYLRLSETQHELHNLSASKKYAQLAHSNFIAAKSQKGLAASNRALGDLERLTSHESADPAKSLDSSARSFGRSLAISRSLGDSVDMAITYESMGHLYILKKDVPTSLNYYNNAANIYQQKGMIYNVAALSERVARNMLMMDNLPEAKKWLDRALVADGGNKRNSKDEELLLVTQALYFEKINDWKTAFKYNSEVLALKTRNLNETQQESITNINLAYENELNLAEMAAQKKQHILQKRLTNTLLILFSFTGIACILFYLLFVKYRKTSRENAMLVKEQNHRTKNNLQSVSDLLSLQMYNMSDPEAIEAMEESLLRVQAMTLVHRSLYQGEELVYIGLNQYIPDLINMVLQSYRRENVRTFYAIDPVLLHTDHAISLGLFVNELTTNSCKYAFASHTSPELNVSCRMKNEEMIFTFRDNGAGIASELTQNKGFGLKLIHILAERLKGKIDILNRDGFAFSLSFKAEIKPAAAHFTDRLKVS